MSRGVLVAAAAALLLAGCATKVAAPLLLTVPPVPAPAAAIGPAPTASSPAPAPVLVLRRVALPEYLLARHVRYRDSASTLAEWPDAVWAERLEIGVTREMAAALRERLPGWTVCEATCPDGSTNGLLLRVDFAPLDLHRSARRLSGRAAASLSRGTTTLWTWTQPVDVPTSADTPQAHAGALAAALASVADALAERLRGPR